ncbi:ABC transporter substrate-binding protein [Streptomyces sp. NBC_00151]|uniref:ABC transporter substrate-binding protein n=1 Tax=Streptomyces sp. NBC_00151 TaxID=2975669 RepID=UPI002DDBF1FF|nr:extracellular solute-binding protein [Streptomyces sp. NBC_00151]WRZ43597.1 extracellular solute-binding protein [Streptomyces sp. NBC_00151]
MTLLTNCSVIGAGSDTSDTEVSVRANITDKASMQAVVAAFHRARPGIHVSVSYADTNTLQKELPQQLRAGKAPDVFTVWPGSGNPASVLALKEDDFLEALSLRFFAGRIPDSMRPVTDGGVGTYLVPVTFSAVGAIYSAETLKAIGGTRPTTYSTLLALCDTARRHGKVLFALGNQTPWVTQLVDYALVATTVYAHDPGFDTQMESGKESFARSGWRQAMAKYLEMRDRGCFSTAPLKTSYEDALDQVADGRAVGVVQVAGTLAALRSAAPGMHFRMTALPATDQPNETRIPGAVSAAYGLNAKAPHRKAALAFVDFLGSERGQNLYNRSGATLPALPSNSFSADPAVAEVARRQKDGTTVPFMDQRWPNSEVQQTHFEQVRALFAGTTDIAHALAAMDSAYE